MLSLQVTMDVAVKSKLSFNMKRIILWLLFTSSMHVLHAQDYATQRKARKQEKNRKIDEIVKMEEEGVLKYKKHFLAAFKLNNDGYGGFLEYGKVHNKKRALLFQLDISERKHIKEEKMQNQSLPTSPLIYGKLNFFYPVKCGVQQQYVLGNKGNRNGVSITGNLGGGFSFGVLRPYMLQVNPGNDTLVFVRYNTPDSIYYVDDQKINSIAGGPDLNQGWKYLSMMPGLYVKSSLRFDYGKYNEVLSGLEVGVHAEYYSKNIPQMAHLDQKNFFMGVYIALLFGKRK